MVTINYQVYGTKGFKLRLRFYQNGKTKYVTVNHLLTGNLQKKHWNRKKEIFIPSAPNAEQNNAVLAKFKEKYLPIALGRYKSIDEGFCALERKNNDPDKKTVKWLIGFVVEKMKRKSKNADDTLSEGYSAYTKLDKRLEEYCKYAGIDYDELLVSDMTFELINAIFKWVSNRGTGRCVYISQSLHSILNTATKYGWYNINKVEMCDWIPKEGKGSKKYHTLTNDMCKKLIELPDEELPKGQLSSLYRDFCIFILYTCQSPCDAISLKYSDIQNINGQEHFVFKRRKIAAKQKKECSVPINLVMRKIMNKWKPLSKDGYIFPIRSKERIKNNKVENGDIKHFIGRLNVWLKKLTKIIGCPFDLHSYAFRHTGITHYISQGVPITYVANLAGTSISNIEDIYYNNQGDVASRDKVLNAIGF